MATKKVIGGDGLVDGETTYGEDIKGNSTVFPVEKQRPAEPAVKSNKKPAAKKRRLFGRK